jgi:SAM-dependent methyltransferase
MKCRHCNSELEVPLIDLGVTAPSNSYLENKQLIKDEKEYPLKVLVCSKCWLVQTEDFVGAEQMFSHDYAYFSSFSSTWLNHAKQYVEMISEKLQLSNESCVVEIAANDGYLLQYMRQKKIPCYGIDPTYGTASFARKKGIEMIVDFFTPKLAYDLFNKNRQADLMIANNVLAHVPDINGFVESFSILLKPSGVITFEFPHLLNLIEKNQFDTIYHEHYSYLSVVVVQAILKNFNLEIFNIDELPTHGGSVRVYAQKNSSGKFLIDPSVDKILKKEIKAGVKTTNYYKSLQKNADEIKENFILLLNKLHNQGYKVAAYGAAAKGSTLINFSGVTSDLISCVADKNTSKQGKLLPSSHIPIVSEADLINYKPDYVLILPWNIKDEVIDQLSYVREWGGKFVTIIPSIEIS